MPGGSSPPRAGLQRNAVFTSCCAFPPAPLKPDTSAERILWHKVSTGRVWKMHKIKKGTLRCQVALRQPWPIMLSWALSFGFSSD